MFNGSLYEQKIKMSIIFTYSECATGKWYHSIELTESFLLTYRCWTLQRSHLALYERSIERPASLTQVDRLSMQTVSE